MKKKIIFLPGDGIGPEIMDSALQILQAIANKHQYEFEIETYDFGGIAIDRKGSSLPEETLKACLNSDAVLLAAVGGPKWSGDGDRPEKGLLAIRKALNLYANVRGLEVFPQLATFSPLKEENVKNVDFIVVRELIGGIYFGEPKKFTHEEAMDTLMYTREEIERIITFAFETARKRRKKVTSIDKENVLSSSKLWREVALETAKKYPDVELEHLLVDAAAMELIRCPSRFDVIVTENMFGDILSDEASMIAGSLGLLPSASYSTAGPTLYEPIHGSAPDIAGQNIANPIGMIRSMAMMLNDFDLKAGYVDVEKALHFVLDQGIRTKDLGGTASTTEFTQAMIAVLK